MDFEIIIKFITGGLNHDPTTPTLDKVINNNLVFIIFLSLILIALIVGKYGLGMKMLGKKKAWKAIIPVYGLMLLFRAVDLNAVMDQFDENSELRMKNDPNDTGTPDQLA